MKKIYITILFIISFTTQNNAQTEKETLDFLNTMITSYAAPMGNETAKVVIQSQKDNNSKKIFSISLIIGGDLLSTSYFYPSDVNNVITYRAPNGNLCLKIISSSNKIYQKYASSNEGSQKSDIRIVVKTEDKEVERIRKALIHLLELNNAPIVNDKLFTD